MIIWVDADACPGPVRDIILRAAYKRRIKTIFVANKPLYLQPVETVSCIQVEQGSDIADAYIVAHAAAGDLVVTQDIPLAAQLIANDVSVVSPRGDHYSAENIAENLSRRNLLQDLRDQGEIMGGPPPFDEKTKRQFANCFDAEVQRLLSRR